MKPLFHRDTLVRAVLDNDVKRLNAIAAQLAATGEYRRLLQALGHCPDCAARAASNKPAIQ